MRAQPVTDKSERARVADAVIAHFPGHLGLEIIFHHGKWYVVAFTSMARRDEEVFVVLESDGMLRFQSLDEWLKCNELDLR